MAKLTGQTIADSYDQLLIVGDANGITATAQAVESADTGGNASLLYLSTTEVYSPGKAGTSNTVFGKAAGASLDAGSNYNVFIGENVSDAAMNDATNNVGVGYQSLSALTTGDKNIAIGVDALLSCDTGSENTVIGNIAGDALVGSSGNVLVGAGTLTTSTSGTSNVCIGTDAGSAAGDVDNTVIIGKSAAAGALTDAADGTVAIGKSALNALTSGSENTAIGYQALLGHVGGDKCTAIGYQAMYDTDAATVQNSDNNLAIGYRAMSGTWANNKSEGNTAIGNLAMAGLMDDAASNVAIGQTALTSLVSGSNTVAIGYGAGSSLTSGNSNTIVGQGACNTGTLAADGNVVVGQATAQNLAGGALNTIIGAEAGNDLVSGANNVLVGSYAGDALGAGESFNISIGQHSMGSWDEGTNGQVDHNIAIGYQAFLGGNMGTASETAVGNIAIGSYALDSTSADDKTGTVAIGYSALTANTSGEGNIAIGYQAGQLLTTGGDNTIIGYLAMDASIGDADSNVAIGTSSMGGSHTGTRSMKNVAVGKGTMAGAMNAADENTAVGYNALTAVTTASQNVAVGANALTSNTTANNNVAVGKDALTANTIGNANVAVGTDAMTTNVAADRNVAVGEAALSAMTKASTTDTYNTAVGYNAGFLVTSGENNTCIGGIAGNAITSGSQNTVIGHGSDADPEANNQIAVGYGSVATATNETIWGNASNTPNNITNDWTVTSDERIKKDIEDSDIGLSFVNSLRTRKFKRKHPSEWDAEILEERYKRGGGNYDDEKDEVIKDEFDEEKVWNGLIAQEVKESMDELGVEFSGWNESSNSKQGIQYSTMVVPLIKAVQELSQQVEDLKAKVGE